MMGMEMNPDLEVKTMIRARKEAAKMSLRTSALHRSLIKLLDLHLKAPSRIRTKIRQIMRSSPRSPSQARQTRDEVYLARLAPLPLFCPPRKFKPARDHQALSVQRYLVECYDLMHHDL